MSLAQNPALSTTLPRDFYGEGPLFEAELERLWYKQWLYMAHVSEVPDPGDYIVREVLGESVLVIRTSSGEIAALLNVCRHRGSRLVDGACGHAKRLVCPYHQWTYDLDGRLLGAPSMRDGDDVDFDELGLYRLPLEVWRGMVFASLGETPPPPLGPEIEAHAPRLADYSTERLCKVHMKTYDAACNWTLLLENYLECYHCAGSHPEFCLTANVGPDRDESYGSSYTTYPYWGVDLPLLPGAKTASTDGELLATRLLVGSEHAEDAIGWSRGFVIQPAFTVAYFYADYGMVHELRPVSARATQFHIHWFVHVERTQLGLRSRRYSPGPSTSPASPGSARRSRPTWRSWATTTPSQR